MSQDHVPSATPGIFALADGRWARQPGEFLLLQAPDGRGLRVQFERGARGRCFGFDSYYVQEGISTHEPDAGCLFVRPSSADALYVDVGTPPSGAPPSASDDRTRGSLIAHGIYQGGSRRIDAELLLLIHGDANALTLDLARDEQGGVWVFGGAPAGVTPRELLQDDEQWQKRPVYRHWGARDLIVSFASCHQMSIKA